MGIFDWFKANDDEPTGTLPWDRHPSIYEHILAHTETGKVGLKDGGETLPDDERFNAGRQFRWASGAFDGVISHHMSQGETDDEVDQIYRRIRLFCDAPTAANKLAIYEAAIQEGLLGLIDPVIERVVADAALNHQRLYELAESLTTAASDRGPVKLGVALWGLFDNPDNLEIFRVLGRHEEFTLFAAVALTRHSHSPEQELWDLAKHVDGWGRIHIVERLAESTDPTIKDWLLREGFRNSIMNEYLAYTCAMAGELRSVLERDEVDDELLVSAGELIDALLAGGPTTDIRGYEEGASATERFLHHLATREVSISQFLTVSAIRDFVCHEGEDWDSLQSFGWDETTRARLQEMTADIITRTDWTDRVRAALDSEDAFAFFNANQAAKRLNIDTWSWHRRRIEQKPTDSGRWFHLLECCNDERIDDALGLANKLLDLQAIASGPGNEMGLGPGFEQHQCLDAILHSLGDYAGKGMEFVQTGLRSPVVRNRNSALRVLADWGRAAWPNHVESLVQSAIKAEPDEEIRRRMQNLLDGKPFEPGSSL